MKTMLYMICRKLYQLQVRNDCVTRDRLVMLAVKYGHVEVLDWLLSNGSQLDSVAAFTGAAECGQLHMLKYLRARPLKFIESPNGRRLQRSMNSRLCMERAAIRGHLHILKWLRSECGCLYNYEIFRDASYYGHLDILKWIRSEGYLLDEQSGVGAVIKGHLHVLKWLRSEGCPWNPNLIFYARSYGHQEIINWALENGCPDPVPNIAEY